MSDEKSTGTSITTILLVIFITLKLAGVINWSWWWVLSPLWIGVSLAIVLFGIFILIDILQK